jgi:uncharacterized membrane protein YccC
MSRIATEWRSLRAQVLKHRVQLGLSLRVTIAALLSFMLSHLLHLPLPLWAVLTAVLLTQVSFGRSLKATIDYLAGTLGGAVYAAKAKKTKPREQIRWRVSLITKTPARFIDFAYAPRR